MSHSSYQKLQFREALESIAERLDAAIIAIAGKEAEWQPGPPYPGIDASAVYQVTGKVLEQIAAVREEANSVLHWVDSGQSEEL